MTKKDVTQGLSKLQQGTKQNVKSWCKKLGKKKGNHETVS